MLANPASLHHALLLAGPSGIGKSAFADALAARLLCEGVSASAAFACGSCDACRWLSAGNHPDFRKVSLSEEGESGEGEEGKSGASGGKKGNKSRSSQIRIDQIRELEDFVFVGSHRHGNRVVIIDPAEAMNAAASNSLLKILEEPTASIYFIIVSSHWRSLLPTLRSRCRLLAFGIPDPKLAEDWLATQGISDPRSELRLTGGAPLTVLSRSGKDSAGLLEAVLSPLGQSGIEPLGLAALWEAQLRGNDRLTLEILVDTLQRWVYDLMRIRLNQPARYLVDKASRMEGIASSADTAKLTRCYGDLLKIRRVVNHPLNTQLFLEDLAVRYLTAVAGPRP